MNISAKIITTVEPLNNGYIGGKNLVLCWEVVPFLEVALKIIVFIIQNIIPKVCSRCECTLKLLIPASCNAIFGTGI